MQSVGGHECSRQRALEVCDRRSVDRGHVPAVRRILQSPDRRHGAAASLHRVLDRGPPDRQGLLAVGRRQPVRAGTLQVVGNRPVVLVAEALVDHARHRRARPAELHITARITRLFQDQAAIGAANAFGHGDRAVAEALGDCLHAGEEGLLVKRHLGHQHNVGRTVGVAPRRQRRRRSQPAGVAAHHFHDEHAALRPHHRGDVEPRLEHRGRQILGCRPEARTAVGADDVVVHGLGHADALQRVPAPARLGLQAGNGVHRTVAAVVEQPTDAMGVEHREQAVHHRTAIVTRQIEAARAERPTGRACQPLQRSGIEGGRVEQVFAQHATDAPMRRKNPAHAAALLACSLDDGGGGGIDHGSHATGMRIEERVVSHGWRFLRVAHHR